MRVRIGFGALVGSIVLAIATTAHTVAGGAGANGRIAFDRADPQSPGDTFIYTANPDTRARKERLHRERRRHRTHAGHLRRR